MNDMSEANFILSVKVEHNCLKRTLFLSQESYINMILKQFNMATYKFVDTPIAKGENCKMCSLTPNEKHKMSKVPYLCTFGNLMYVMMCTWPDIAYVVWLVSKYQSNPK